MAAETVSAHPLRRCLDSLAIEVGQNQVSLRLGMALGTTHLVEAGVYFRRLAYIWSISDAMARQAKFGVGGGEFGQPNCPIDPEHYHYGQGPNPDTKVG